MPVEPIPRAIPVLRGHKILLDAQLAELYGIATKSLLETVKRNAQRFPEDFMFQLTADEWDALTSQFVTSKAQSGGGRSSNLPYAFTDQGVAMLSSVLHSDRAIAVNIQVLRVFARMRALINTDTDLVRRLTRFETRLYKKLAPHDEPIIAILSAIRKLMPKPVRERPPFEIPPETDEMP
jgi:hypothetical protein